MAQPIAMSKKIHPTAEIDENLKGFSTEEMVHEILRRLGEDPSRDGLLIDYENATRQIRHRFDRIFDEA